MKPTLWVVKFRAVGAAEEDTEVLPRVFLDKTSMLDFIKNECTEPGEYTEMGIHPPPGKSLDEAKAEIEALLTKDKH